MKTTFLRSSFLLVVLLVLSWLRHSAHAQQPNASAVQQWSPTLADPTYVLRKQQRANYLLANTQPAPRKAYHETAGVVQAALPACFEPLDTTAAGGWHHLSRQGSFADDSYKGPIPLGFNFSLYGAVYNQVYINTNGNITFGQGFTTFTATGLPGTNAVPPMIAPFWADVDTELADTLAMPYPSGNIWFKVFPNRLVVTWNRVAYFARNADKKNTFQVTIMANTAPGFTGNDVFFAYGDMQWTTGGADGSNNGFGGTPATVGINKGDGSTFVQVGRFNINDSSHPDNQVNSGVNWLDNQCFAFQVGSSSSNVPPTASGLPAGNTITLGLGETRNLALQFLGPETGQTVTVTTNTNGLCNTTVNNSGTANPTVSISLTGAACNLGTHTISLLAVDNGSPVAQQQFDLTVVVVPTIQWTGAVSTVYTNPANWSANAVPTATDDAAIPAGVANMPTLSSSAAVRSLTIASGATLTVAAGGVFSLNANLTNNGLLTGAGTLQTTGAAQQTFAGSGQTSVYYATITAAGVSLSQPLAIDRLLTLNGDLASNGNLVLRSRIDGSETAMVVNNGSAVVTGSATVERFIGPFSSPQMGYRQLSAPVTNTTLADMGITGVYSPVLNTAYNSATNPGSVTPFPNVFRYDQSRVGSGATAAAFDQGWLSPANSSEAMTPGLGYTVNIMGGQLMNFVGTLGNNPVTWSSLPRSTGDKAGWHLLGNPYPAPINFSQLTRSGLDNAVYVFKSSGQYTGSYASYVNGVPANGGSNILPLGQAFFVHTATPGVSGSLSFTNAARLTTYQNPALQRGTTAETRPLLQLDLRTASTTATDQIAVYFEQGASSGFDIAFDALHISGGNPVQLGALANGQELSISGLPVLGSSIVTVPLAVRVAQAGSYTLQVTQLINLPTGWTVNLRDAQTGTVTDLQVQASYNCTIVPGEAPGRFSLEFTPGRALAANQAQLNAAVSVYPNPARGTVSLGLPATKSVSQVLLFNALGQQVLMQEVPAAHGNAVTLPLAGLAKGVYMVRVALAEGTVTKRLVIE